MHSANSQQKRITLRDVAEASGYSLRTVKKVLGSNEYVSENVRQGVLAASEALGYQKNKIASALARNQTRRIAVMYAETSKSFFHDVRQGFNACFRQYRDFGFEVDFFVETQLDGNLSDMQLKLLRDISNGDEYDGYILHPFFSEGIVAEINRLNEAGKPVVTFGTDVPESQRFFHIGPDGKKSGRIAAQLMGHCMRRDGHICVLNSVSHLSGHQQTAFREEGFIEKMKTRFPDIKITRHEYEGVLNDEKHYEYIKGILKEDTFSGIFATSSYVYLVGRALKELNIRDVVVIGYDLPDQSKQLLKDEWISVIMFQNPWLQAYTSLKTLCDYLLDNSGSAIEPQYIDVQILTGECIK